MRRYPLAFTAGLLFAGLLVMAYFATTLLAGPTGFLYRNAGGFSEAQSITQFAALIAGIAVLALALFVAVPLALRPAPFRQKLLDVIPVWLIGLTLGGAAMLVFGIGTTGMVNLGFSAINFAQGWFLASGVLALLAMGIAAAMAPASAASVKAGATVMGVTALPVLATTLGVLATVAIVATTQPRLPAFGGDFPGGRPGGQAGQAQSPAGAQRPGIQAQGTPGAQGRTGGQTPGGGQGFPNGGQSGGPGGGAGGPPGGGPFGAGGFAAMATRYEVGGGLTALFGLLAIAGGAAGLVAMRRKDQPIAGEQTPISIRGFAWGKAVGALAAVTAIAFLAIQLVPVAHANPPQTAPVPWDSAQTEQLWNRACANCHSNATVWPVYAFIAPSSWLNAIDVNDARNAFNMSELDKMPAFSKRQYPDEAAERLRNSSMPPADYLLLHPEAHLTDAEKDLLAQGLAKTLGRAR